MTNNKSAVKDMTVGSPTKLILGFALPLLGGNLFQQLYSMVDTFIVGKTLGVEALAGVGATGSLHFLIVGFCIGICSGFSIPIAQYFGAKDFSSMRKTVAHSYYVTAFFLILMTTLSVLLTPSLLRIMNTPSNIFDYAKNYIVVLFLGIPAMMMYNLFSGFIRALGDSKAPVVILVISSVTNIILDLMLILGLHMGVAGAAWATDISQAMSAVISYLYIRKKIPLLTVKKEEWRYDWRYIKNLFIMGVPMGLQYSITAIGAVVLQVGVNSLGSVCVASMTASSKVAMFFECPISALAGTMATYAGQNVGAKKLDRLDKGLGAASIYGTLYCILIGFVMSFWGGKLAMLFIDQPTQELLDLSSQYLFINALFYVALLFVNIVRFTIQGMGFPGFAIIAGVCEMFARAGASIFLIPIFGWVGASLGGPLAWVAADLFLIPAYFMMRKRLKRLFGLT